MEPFVDAKAVAEHLKITRRQALEMTRRESSPATRLALVQAGGCGGTN